MSNPIFLLSVLSASLLGSLHCAGMCGGMVGFATGSLNRKRRLPGHLSYHLGRLTAYLSLGALAGALGLGLDTAAARGGVGGGAALVAGLWMIAWALIKIAPSHWGVSRVWDWLPAIGGCGFSRSFTYITQLPEVARAAAVGLATGLLPCGWLYAFVLAAVATSSVTSGAAVLLAFWVGTLPALVGVGGLAHFLGRRAQRLLPTFSALTLLALGLSSVWSRYQAAAYILPLVPTAWNQSAPVGEPSAPPLDSTDIETLPPCHQH